MANAQVVLITGGNTGLGYETVRALYQAPQPYHILMGCRSLREGEAAVAQLRAQHPQSHSTVVAVELDITSDASIAAVQEHISAQHGQLHILVNNAGVGVDRAIQAGEVGLREGWMQAWAVNVVGAHALTTALVPLLLRAGPSAAAAATTTLTRRIIFITSGTSVLADTERMDRQYATINAAPPAGWPKPATLNPTEAYRSSKTGLNMLMRQWHRILLNDGVKVFAVAPGFLSTDLNGIGREKLTEIGALDPSVGANFVKDVIMGQRDADEGKAINVNGVQAW